MFNAHWVTNVDQVRKPNLALLIQEHGSLTTVPKAVLIVHFCPLEKLT